MVAAAAAAAVGWNSVGGAKTGINEKTHDFLQRRVDPAFALACILTICFHKRCNLLLLPIL